MSVSATGSNSSSSAAALTLDAASQMKKSTGMNKDDFLKLFITQLQNQDPTKPQDTSQFITQLAQLTQVEQAYNTNTNLQNIANSESGSSAIAAANFINKTATATVATIAVDAPGGATFMVGGAQTDSSSTVTITDGGGNVVKSAQVSMSRGVGQFVWDGLDDHGAAVPVGDYRVTSTSGSGNNATAGQIEILGKVTGIDIAAGVGRIVFGGISVPLVQVTSVRG